MDFSLIINQVVGAFWYLIPIGIIVLILKSRWFKGVAGEFAVNLSAKIMLDKDKYHLIKNVTLPTEDGSTQIDHVIVSLYGIFVVETKNMKGWIFGRSNQKTWTQKIYKYSSKFQNPLHQNYKHVKTLQSLLGVTDDKIFSLVVFVGGSTFKTKMPENVTYLRGYVRFIKSKTQPVLSESDVNKITIKIETGRLTPSLKTSRDHVKHVKHKRFDSSSDTKKDDAKTVKITSSKLAAKLKLKTPELIGLLIAGGYVKKTGEKQVLTDKGAYSGGEAKKGRFGEYFIWPKSFVPMVLSESDVNEITIKIETGRLTPSLKTSRDHVKHVKHKRFDSSSDTKKDGAKTVKITSSKLAAKLKLKTPELIELLIAGGYVKETGEKQVLTDKGAYSGGEAKKGRFGEYFIWPKSFVPMVLSESDVNEITIKIETGRLTPSLKTSRDHVKHVKHKRFDSSSDTKKDGAKTVKITSSKLAAKLKLKTPELIELLIAGGYVKETGEKQVLTDKGAYSGGEAKKGRFGEYFIWPKSFVPK